jgi:long-chain acyl-CoA synthetase
MLGTLKGGIVNLVVGKVKKMVPAYTLPGAVAFKDVLAQGRAKTLQKVAVGPDDVAFLQYTGGTTGVSKGATLLHRNVVANMLQNDLWLKPGLEKSGHIQQINIVTALPLYHIFALTACMLLAMRVGGKCILIPNPRDIPALIKDVSKHKVHVFPALNTLFIALMNHPDFGKLDLSELRFSVGGGMATQKAVAERWQQLTKKPLLTGYGLSETSPTLTVDRSDGAGFTGSIGYPVPSTDISIRDDDGGEVPLGQPGEICARGPQVMAGYWNRPDETAKVMTTDGFFRTGDIGVMDANGQITIVDRKKDMIIVSGFNVYPNEIEDVVAHLPGVAECAVIGVPDDRTTEAVMLFIVKKDPSLTEQKVRDYCAENLTNYKRPKHIVFRTELPKTNVGKILRRALRDQLEQEKISA